ncbi:IscS subfamily cysteine desulfurase [Piscirickettsia litoralis]|uniref:cysteine desulfurase n=1 Tax=Piscirickettsia litoralis TaxID=1891921 RepID=A0ABX3A4K3_9GAMM|nr:IscS subfamily cysteine desulfurase [Piscirickettsia litoralis]ODN43797.1 IscS subfamily cysteine desulfurase [Piscirickettsia litoralis]
MIYFDYAATTPIDPDVIKVMQECLGLEGSFGNPSSLHRLGWQAAEKVKQAREQVANLVSAESREIIFTSGATEANNLAIKGVCEAYQKRGRHIITSKAEHKAVLDVFAVLEKQGFDVTYLTPNKQGLIEPDCLQAAMREDTILVSLMYVNNELGVAHDLNALGSIVKEGKAIFHVDAVQALGKLPIDLKELPVDLMSFSAHKCYGPKGVGALFARRRPKVRINAQQHGGGHEFGLRSGTLATHQIVGFGQACELAQNNLNQESERIKGLREQLWQGLSQHKEVYWNGEKAALQAPGILSVSFVGVDGESLLACLPELAVSQGSACNSTTVEPSHVLAAIGVSAQLAHSTVRFSLGRYSTEAEVGQVIMQVGQALTHLRKLSPVWQAREAGTDPATLPWGRYVE